MTVDSNARRQAILFEVAAVATCYEQDTAPGDDEGLRTTHLYKSLEHVDESSGDEVVSAITEHAGRCVAWLEHLEATEAKA
jgi:hypothetical protein